MPRAHILVIEDDRSIREGLVACLELADFTVSSAADFPSGRRAALGVDADLVLLDLVMPGGDGLDILAALRQARPAQPVIILTARGAEQDRVKGLKGGADDYVVKPFGVEELLARVEAVLRRAGVKAAPTGGSVAVPGATVDLARREVRREDGGREELSEQEADLIRFLAERHDRAVPREELLTLLWRTAAPDLGSRAVDMLVARMRAKLGDSGKEPRALVTVRGCGYRLVVEEG
jgi:DNA-binding response OmpR family regulator